MDCLLVYLIPEGYAFRRCLTKKVSAVTFSNDSAWFMVADKFGIVYVFSTASDSDDKSVQLLAHCCSIITAMVLTSLFYTQNC